MEAAIDRRMEPGGRLPLGVLVEFRQEHSDRAFEADGLNLGAGGLALRASRLPEVGARLSCRFASPNDGLPVHAEAEVVWSRLQAPEVGECGIRFSRLDPAARDAISELLGLTPHQVRGAETAAEAGMLELAVDGVGSPMNVRVLQRATTSLVLEQELQLLRLGTGVRLPDQRRGRITSVDLKLRGATPNLLLSVEVDQSAGGTRSSAGTFDVAPPPASSRFTETKAGWGAPTDGEAAAAVQTRELPRGARPTGANPVSAPEVASRAMQQEPSGDTVPDMPAPDFDTSSGNGVSVSGDVMKGASPDGGSLSHDAYGRADRLQVDLIEGNVPDINIPVAEALDAIESDLMHEGSFEAEQDAATRIAPALQERGRSLGQAAREAAQRARRLAPAGLLTRLFATLMLACRSAAQRLRPASAALRQGARVSGRFAGSLVRRTGLPMGPAKRRTTSPAPTRQTRHTTREQQESLPLRARLPLRLIVVGVLVALGIGLSIVALTPAAAPEPSLDEANDPASAVVGDPTFDDFDTPVEPEATIAEPSSPSGPAATGAADPQLEGGANEPAFGDADVPDARTFILRMSRPVETLKGIRSSDGFTIVIPGSLSLDRAGPIAAAHGSVARSMVLNRGDHSVLTIRFERSSAPLYRVVGRGSTLAILIGTDPPVEPSAP